MRNGAVNKVASAGRDGLDLSSCIVVVRDTRTESGQVLATDKESNAVESN